MELNDLLKRQSLAIELAKIAGEIVRKTSGNIKCIDEKASFADLVTESDKAVEKLIYDRIQQQYPNDKFIGEETASDAELADDPTWIIDPIDGTTNFIHTFPFSCISIGLTVNKEPCLGVVYNPLLNHLYTAIKGQGAQLTKSDGTIIKLQVRPCPSLAQALVIVEIGGQRDEKKKECVFRNIESIGWQCHGIRALGSAALNICSVASGYADAYYEFGNYIWDICAGIVILREAGGFVCDTTGSEINLKGRRLIAASSPELAKQVSAQLKVSIDYV